MMWKVQREVCFFWRKKRSEEVQIGGEISHNGPKRCKRQQNSIQINITVMKTLESSALKVPNVKEIKRRLSEKC